MMLVRRIEDSDADEDIAYTAPDAARPWPASRTSGERQ